MAVYEQDIDINMQGLFAMLPINNMAPCPDSNGQIRTVRHSLATGIMEMRLESSEQKLMWGSVLWINLSGCQQISRAAPRHCPFQIIGKRQHPLQILQK